MTSIINQPFNINGVVSTDKTVLDNLNTLCSACATFLSFDVNTGLWSVIINRPGTSVASFTDSNIIGNINVSGSGINELYNSVSVEFPHKDLNDGTDYIDLEIPSGDRFPNELDNRLNLTFDCINDPIQAQYIGTVELKQSRIDKIVQFTTDFTKLGLKAGDLIDITNTMYGYAAKMFRIIRVVEEDLDDGNLTLKITAQEYDEDVYDTDGLIRKQRTKKTGILPKELNQEIAGDLKPALLYTFTILQSPNEIRSKFNAFMGNAPWGGATGITRGDLQDYDSGYPGDQNSIVVGSFKTTTVFTNLILNCLTPIGIYDYRVRIDNTTIIRTGLYGFIPTRFKVFKGSLAIANRIRDFNADWQTQNAQIILVNLQPDIYYVTAEPVNTYDLDQEDAFVIYPYNISQMQTQANGAGFTITGLGLKS